MACGQRVALDTSVHMASLIFDRSSGYPSTPDTTVPSSWVVRPLITIYPFVFILPHHLLLSMRLHRVLLLVGKPCWYAEWGALSPVTIPPAPTAYCAFLHGSYRRGTFPSPVTTLLTLALTRHTLDQHTLLYPHSNTQNAFGLTAPSECVFTGERSTHATTLATVHTLSCAGLV